EAALVHRDVKPANILLDARDHVYLTDFGLARHTLSDPGLTAPGAWVGTLDFVAPEQIRGERVDGRADVYALGCVRHFALTAQLPYPRETSGARLRAPGHAAPPEPSQPEPSVPGALDAVVRRALAKRAEERQQSAGELGAAAVAGAGGIAPPAPSRTTRRRRSADAVTVADRPARRRRRPALATLAALLAAAIGAA